MAYVNCPSCGLTALTFARWSTVDTCTYCDAPIRRAHMATEGADVDSNYEGANKAALQGDRRSRLSESGCQVRSDRAWEPALDSERPQ